ncbi:hypothetical protein [Amycolatopsis sp. DSM 110486]|uniref:hypothetical protein n=1 Tax=Amycolatopsis sp. DSM 110486 TaxID=2865832 RepID=UPI001C699898|nr:hypothetical protein [Amycolatopsis sp. DSM 110486]QYN17219.1 hypothetical protein K1T34_30865 [Amycolatopsis sp. DSM 110486]
MSRGSCGGQAALRRPTARAAARPTAGHRAFGHGPYLCLGAPQARLELQAVFTALPRLVPDLRLAVPADDPRLRADVGHTAFAELPVTW